MTGDLKKVGAEGQPKKASSSMNDAVRATEEIRQWRFQTMGIPQLAESLNTSCEKGLTDSAVKQK
jgi:hypothetical protein